MTEEQDLAEETIKFLNSIGYQGEYYKDSSIYVIETRDLRIGVFPKDYPNTRLCGRVVAEFKNCFDKWTNAYYIVDFPKGERAKKIMQQELVEICTREHYERSNNHKTYPGNSC